MQNALASFRTTIIEYDIEALGQAIMSQISDVGRLHVISAGDLQVFGIDAATVPADVKVAVQYGTKFFDALLYFALEVARRPAHQVGVDVGNELPAIIMTTKKHLLWMAIYLMLRGSYPTDADNAIGANVPAFLRNICGMQISPADLAASLASFELKNLNPNWIKEINWTNFAPEIRQRLGLGLAGYRMLSPFSCYEVRNDAPADVRNAAAWVARLNLQPPDYSILSCTRSPGIVNRFKSWNKALGNLILLAFTDVQINEMVANRIIFAVPVRDPRSDNWRQWAEGGDLVLNDPVRL
jgi:hypothetical protein